MKGDLSLSLSGHQSRASNHAKDTDNNKYHQILPKTPKFANNFNQQIKEISLNYY